MTRNGKACQSPAVKGKKRCRMHGGAKGSGAQPGNRNAWKHGLRSAAVQTDLRQMRALVKAAQALIAE
ncbi:HGGxSTG domain-containing protein [Sphingopyxis fribergensis]